MWILLTKDVLSVSEGMVMAVGFSVEYLWYQVGNGAFLIFFDRNL
jgi:hypothetical protein